jgi:multicomponent Na+:H+ antiporter subunit D
MLGYSSISQMGYIMLGFATGTPIGILGGLFHLINHGIFKSLLFLNAGTIESVTGTKQLDKMQGIGNRMPITAVTSTIGALSTAGIPPLNGFWSKLFIIIALVQSGWKITAGLAVLASILTLWYFLILQRKTFFCSGSDVWNNVKEPSFWMSFSVIILALLCIISGIFYPVFITGWLNPAANVFSAGTGFLAQVLK